jgi:hypothetical protein
LLGLGGADGADAARAPEAAARGAAGRRAFAEQSHFVVFKLVSYKNVPLEDALNVLSCDRLVCDSNPLSRHRRNPLPDPLNPCVT